LKKSAAARVAINFISRKVTECKSNCDDKINYFKVEIKRKKGTNGIEIKNKNKIKLGRSKEILKQVFYVLEV
jgi:hypothetical protein